MNSKDKQEDAESAFALNTKIEALMGPTPDGGTPIDTSKIKDKDQPKPLPKKGAPVVPKGADPLKGQHPKPSEDYIGKQPPAAAKPDPEPVDPKLDAAVDDITRKESDTLLDEEDKELKHAFEPRPDKKKGLLKRWWGNKTARRITFIVLLLLIAAAAVVPDSRYFVLNSAGVRVRSSLVVVDQSTKQPLKNVNVTIAGTSAVTDDMGQASVDNLKLGKTTITVDRRAFATVDKNVTLGWGSNPLGDIELQPTGVRYTYNVKDFLSAKPIVKAEAFGGAASAFSDETGKLVVTLDKNDIDQVKEVTLTAAGYRQEKLKLGEDTEPKDIALVPARQHAFVSKRSGKYDLYKIDIDGKNEKLVLAGTGSERDSLSLTPHPTQNVVAYVSTREGARGSGGQLMSTLLIVDLGNTKAAPKNLGKGDLIQIVGWTGGRLAYVQVSSSDKEEQRQRLMVYNHESGETKELAKAHNFNDVVIANDTIYFAPADNSVTVDGETTSDGDVGLFSVQPDGSSQKRILDQETWNIYRVDPNTITFAAGQDWYNLKLGTDTPEKAAGPPVSQKTRIYVNNPAKSRSLWIDQRDGKGVLLLYTVDGGKETTLQNKSGLKYPLSWVSDTTAIYRINTESETADYAFSIDGGEAKKIADVTNTDSSDAWYYY